jgi:hypothetical protein
MISKRHWEEVKDIHLVNYVVIIVGLILLEF